MESQVVMLRFAHVPWILLWLFCFAVESQGLDYVTVKRGGQEREIVGRIEVEAVDGGVLLLARDGELWAITAEELVSKRSDQVEFKPFTRTEMNKQLLERHPGFKLHQTVHYTICYNTSPAYAQWVGSLYERLYDGFYNFWSKKGLKLAEPSLPLVALVFDTRANYDLHARRDLGDAAGAIIGYYSLQTNQVTMYDLTGLEGVASKTRGSSAARINTILSQPAAERSVATIVHEATHQLVYNSQLQARYADIPFWMSEGLAVYFETPDLESAKGWKRIGGVNRHNLIEFHKWLRERPANSIPELLTNDKRFRDPQQASAAYAEAWAFTYFLMRTRGEEYANYMQKLAELKPLVALEPQQRLEMFTTTFGHDLNKLDAEFIRYLRGVD
jgi:Protein of unknown function (DUF1570)